MKIMVLENQSKTVSCIISERDSSNNFKVMRKDGDICTKFDSKTGMRISFSDKNIENYRTNSPLLVDMKITDFCPNVHLECYKKYCYQGSTKVGKHADYGDIKDYILWMKDNFVLECAIGGGACEYHPNFTDIIESLYDNNICPSFTVSTSNFLKTPKIFESVKNNVKGIGISIFDKTALMVYHQVRGALPSLDVKAQLVFGANSGENTLDVLRECRDHRIPVLLLGPKLTNRGEGYNYFKMKKNVGLICEVLQEIQETGASVSVDTSFVQQHKDILNLISAIPESYQDKEGEVSFYIDAVAKTFSKSSYSCEVFKIHSVNDLDSFWRVARSV